MPARLNLDTTRVVELYGLGLSAHEVGEMLGCSKTPVLRALRELGIQLKKRRIDIDIKKMIELYGQGFTSREIARILNCSKNTVLRRLRESGAKLRSKPRELPYLKPGKDLAYVLGVAFGDGRKRSDGLHLWVKDRDFAEAFADACERLGFKPRRYFKEEDYEVCVYSIEFGRWLKSLTYERVEELLVDEEAKKAFVRGYFDSDGCATINPIKEYQNCIEFGDPNLSLLRLVTKVCSDLGIETSIYGPYRNLGSFGKGNSMYKLHVRAKSRRHFAQLIGSSLARKREVLEKISRFYS